MKFMNLFRTPSKKNDELVFRLVLIASGFVSGAISLLIGLRQSVWFDEAYSIIVAKRPLMEIFSLSAVDVHPPVYYLLLKGWAGVFGWSELALRSFSVFALVGTIIIAGLLIKKLFGVRIATVSLLVIMIAPMLLRYGFEIRMYALAMLIGVAATYALVSAMQGKNRSAKQWKITYVLLVALGMYTLYYLALLWSAHLAWIAYLQFVHKGKVARLWHWVLLYGMSFVLFLPQLPLVIKQFTNGALAPISQPLDLQNLIGIASFNTVYQPLWMLTMVTSVVVLIALGAIIYLIITAFKVTKDKDGLVLLAMYIGVPVALLMTISFIKGMYVERYLVDVTVGLLLLVGVSLGIVITQKSALTLKKRTGLAVAVFVSLSVGVMQLFSMGNYNFQRLEKPSVERLASSVDDCGILPIVAEGPYTAIELDYYLGGACDIYFVSESAELGGGYAPLSQSELRVRNLDEVAFKDFVYVTYNKEEANTNRFKKVTEADFGKLSKLQFSAE